ncbi:hypothetical protein GOODEAATRI_008422, partial [Goodea atripinnis]
LLPTPMVQIPTAKVRLVIRSLLLHLGRAPHRVLLVTASLPTARVGRGSTTTASNPQRPSSFFFFCNFTTLMRILKGSFGTWGGSLWI